MSTYIIKGKVTIGDINLQGATIRIINQETNEYLGDTETDENGEYEFEVASITDKYHVIAEYEYEGQKYNPFSKPFVQAIELESGE